MMRIAIIHGHPTPGGGHFCHALAKAYENGAVRAGHEVREVRVAEMEFSLLRSKSEWEHDPAPPGIAEAQETIGWAGHLVIIHPLWLASMPALLKGFLEQALRPGFAMGREDAGKGWSKRLAGKSARIVVTMGMPALLYRWYFGAHGLKSLERSILAIVGIRPSRHTLIGSIESMSDAKRRAWLDTLQELGRNAR